MSDTRICESGEISGVGCDYDGPDCDLVTVRWLPPYLRDSARAAGYPYQRNNSVALRLCPECWEMIRDDMDADGNPAGEMAWIEEI